MSNVTEQLIDFVEGVTFDQLPSPIVTKTKQMLLDSVGCALAGQLVDRGKIAIEYAHEAGGIARASIIGDGKTSYALASFVNGELINALDYDALGPMVGHVAPYVIPTCLAMAERSNASGKEFITALALSLEIGGRLRLALGKLRILKNEPPYWEYAPFYTYSSNVFGAIAGAAKLIKLDRVRLANAFGIGGASTAVAAGAKWEHTPGPGLMTKYNAWSGWLSQLATVAALFAEKGFTGDTSILDGDDGFWRMMGSPSFDVEVLLNDLGKVWDWDTLKVKRYPVCGANHSGVAAITNLIKQHDIKPEEIEEITVIGDPFLMTANRAGDEIAGFQDTQFRSSYIFALACYYGDKPGPEWQLPSTFNDSRIRELMKKVRIAVHPQADEIIGDNLKAIGPTHLKTSAVEIRARGGKWVAEDTSAAPMTAEEVEEKFRHNASFSWLRSEKIDQIVETVDKLEQIDYIDLLTELVVV